MIVVRLQGGLGNQLFQYAAGRTLADKLGRDLRFDIRSLERPGFKITPRPYLLDRYPVRAGVVDPLRLVLNGFPRSPRLRSLLRGSGLFGSLLLVEQEGRYRFDLKSEARHRAFVYLDGFWQSWRYFASDGRSLREELSPFRPPTGRNAYILGRLAGKKTVCVHVRRGDYVTRAAAAAFHGLVGVDYYRAAVKRLGASARGATFYIFSDEPAWARQHLGLPGKKVFVEHNPVEEPQEDLRLMAACRHFVIANSSFSWWAAWLGRARDKRVVAPKRWFKAGPPVPHLCPPGWLRI